MRGATPLIATNILLGESDALDVLYSNTPPTAVYPTPKFLPPCLVVLCFWRSSPSAVERFLLRQRFTRRDHHAEYPQRDQSRGCVDRVGYQGRRYDHDQYAHGG